MLYNRIKKLTTKLFNQGKLTALTNNTAGTVSDTVPALSATYTPAELRNALASITAKVNALIAAAKN